MKYTLGFNVDHIATIRNARGENYPSLLDLTKMAIDAGAKQITAHLREDRRHIKDDDIWLLKNNISVPLNMEMAVTDEMVNIACKVRPDWVCLVPENRNEITTEGGLNIQSEYHRIKNIMPALKASGIKISLFIDPIVDHIVLAYDLGVDAIEINTGKYSNVSFLEKPIEASNIAEKAFLAKSMGLNVHAGHGLNIQNIHHISQIKEITEFNIGHFLISYALFVGLKTSISRMISKIDVSRS